MYQSKSLVLLFLKIYKVSNKESNRKEFVQEGFLDKIINVSEQFRVMAQKMVA